MRFARWAGILGRSAAGLVKHDSFGMGAALAYYTIFSLGPILIIATAIAGRIIGAREVRSEMLAWVNYYFRPEGARAVNSMIAGAPNLFSSLTATLVGALTLLFAATGVFGRLKHSLNVIWGVDHSRHTLAKIFLVTRLKALVAAFAIGFALFLGILMSAAFANVGRLLGKWLPLPGWLLLAINIVLSLVIIVPLFALIFKYMPDVKVPWRSAWSGAVASGILFQVGAIAMGAYLATRVLGSIYGAAGSVLAVLLWAYYTAQTVLYGAEVCHEHAKGSRAPAEVTASPGRASRSPQP